MKSVATKLINSRKALAVIIVLLVGFLIGGGVIGYQKYDALQKENAKLSNPAEAQKVETDQIKAKVAKLIDLPKDEEPTIATVVDASKLKKQDFFKKAMNGDKVLLFAQAKKAILYRESTNKIIEVAPINLGESTKNDSTDQ